MALAAGAIPLGSSSLSIGQMRRIATLQKNTPIDDGAGGEVDNYVTVLTCRCSLVKASGGLDLLQGGLNRGKRYKMTCRYQLAIVIDTDSIWLIGSDTYRVIDYTLVDDIPHFYQFILAKQ